MPFDIFPAHINEKNFEIVEKSMAALPSKVAEFTGSPEARSRREPSVEDAKEYEDDDEEDDDGPEPLPLYQQRYNFYS